MLKTLIILFFPLIVFSQIPNGSFENWTEGNPDGWTTLNIPGIVTPVTQTTDAQDGSSAVKCEVASFVFIVPIPWPGILISSTEDQVYFPVSEKYTSVKGYIKFIPQGDEDIVVGAVTVLSQDTSVAVGVGSLEIDQAINEFTEFEMPIEYFSTDDPAYMYMEFFNETSDTGLTIGSYFILDNLTLSTVTGIEREITTTPKDFVLGQNYPNPFNPQTKIKYSIPSDEYVNLTVYDNLGRSVRTLVNQNQAAGSYIVNFDASDLAAGIYFYHIQAGEFNQVNRMLLIK